MQVCVSLSTQPLYGYAQSFLQTFVDSVCLTVCKYSIPTIYVLDILTMQYENITASEVRARTTVFYLTQ